MQDLQFGPRADNVLSQLYRTLEGGGYNTNYQGNGAGNGPGNGAGNGGGGSALGRAVCDAISRQREMLAQLKHVVSDLKSLRLKAARATLRMQVRHF